MATFPRTTRTPSGESGNQTFFADADEFDGVLDALHAAIAADALVEPDPFDPAVSGLSRAAFDAWVACEDGAVRFLSRPGLHADHIMAAEHVLDVLRSDGIGDVDAYVVPAALLRAALRHGGQRDVPSANLSRQLGHTGSALSLIIAEARQSEDALRAVDETDDLPPAA